MTITVRPLGLVRALASIAVAMALAIWSSCTSAPGDFRFQVYIDQRVNSVYHAACLGGSIGCSREVFERFWHERLGWIEPDQAALDLWRQVMAAVTDGAPARQPAPLLPNALRYHPAQAARYSVISVAMEARSPSELGQLVEGALSNDRVRDLQATLDHFDERLRSWWSTEGLVSVEALTPEIAERVTADDFRRLAAKVARFLETDLSGRSFNVYVVASPEPRGTAASGTALSSHLLVEAVDVLSSDEIAGIAFHELTHVLYEETPPACRA